MSIAATKRTNRTTFILISILEDKSNVSPKHANETWWSRTQIH